MAAAGSGVSLAVPSNGTSVLAPGLQHLPLPCWLAAADGRVLWVNEAARAFRSDAEPEGTSSLEPVIEGELARGYGSGEPFEMPITVAADRRTAKFLARVRRVSDSAAPAVAWLGVCHPMHDGSSTDQMFVANLAERLRREHSPEAVLAMANKALGEHLGALRVGYGEIDDGGEWLTLRADWTNGVESNSGRFPLASFGPAIVDENKAGRTFVSDSLATDPRIGPGHLEAFSRWGVAALVAVPLIRHDRFRAILSIQSARPRCWSAGDVALMEQAAERTWEALERARVEARLLSTQAQQTFLLGLGDRLRSHEDATAILREAVQMLGQHLAVDRVGYAEMDMEADTLTVDVDWVGRNLQSIVGRYPLMSFGQDNIDALANGKTVCIADVDLSPIVGPDNRSAFDAMGIRSAITVPLVKRDRLIAVLSVQHGLPRDWTEAEVRLVEEVADRTWSTVERATAENALRKSEERLRIALEGAELGTWDYDLVTLDGWWSPRTCEIFGIPYQDVIPAELRFTFIHPDDRERYLREVDEAVFAGEPFSIEYRIVRPDGEVRWVVLRGLVTNDGEGKPVRATGITIDTTERNRTEAELARSREALHQSEKLTALGSLLAGVAHELNNPLAVVVAHAALLEEEAVGTTQAADAIRIRRAAERCAKIVQTFLAMARQQPPERRPLDIAAVLRAALELAGYGLRTSGIEVVTAFQSDLPLVEGDESQLQQVFANLIVNAQQAMLEPQRPRRLTVSAAIDASGMIRIELTDTGTGIAPGAERRIFEPYFTTKAVGAGTGVGLSFSLGVVEAHGGRLELVRSSPEGSTFAVTLNSSGRSSLSQKPEDRAGPPAAKTATVLVVDDEPDLLDALAAILRSSGYAVVTAASGEEAKRVLAEHEVRLVLSDLRMPDLDGPGLFGWLKTEHPQLAERTAFLTGDTLGADAVRFLTKAGRPFLEKPFSPAAVRQLIAELVA
jgi:PAS domain S-box-containing protein